MNPKDWINDLISSSIPLIKAMELEVDSWESNTLTLSAPLTPNINDKGTGFGGSIYSLAVLTGWGAVMIHLKENGITGEVVIHKGDVKYIKPATGDLKASVSIDPKSLDGLKEKSKVKIPLTIEVHAPDLCFEFNAQFVAIRK